MIKKDYLLNQIEMLTHMVAKLILKDSKGEDSIVVFNAREIGLNSSLNEELEKLISEKKINDAENKLFFELENETSLSNFNTAVTFYNKLSALDIGTLKESDFSPEEISQGFGEVCEIYQIVDILF